MMDMLLESLSQGKLCVVDVSQMRGGQAQILSGLILRRIFDRNQEEFTKADSRTIPTIAVIEEAQAVLNERAASAEPYISWVKEGRKYDLGAVLITQQPGSIPAEILSQGDNWFIFHLLSGGDLGNVRRANAHFSEDLLSVLLNEPIPGHCVFWSSVSGTPYPISVRAFSFEAMFKMADPHYDAGEAATFATGLRDRYQQALLEPAGTVARSTDGRTRSAPATGQLFDGLEEAVEHDTDDYRPDDTPDAKAILERRAIDGLRNDGEATRRLRHGTGLQWRGVIAVLEKHLPDALDGRQDFAHQLVPRALNEIFGEDAWEAYRSERGTLYVRAK